MRNSQRREGDLRDHRHRVHHENVSSVCRGNVLVVKTVDLSPNTSVQVIVVTCRVSAPDMIKAEAPSIMLSISTPIFPSLPDDQSIHSHGPGAAVDYGNEVFAWTQTGDLAHRLLPLARAAVG